MLTVHHAMILGNCPTWRTNSFQCIYLFIFLYMFQACHAHHQEKQIVSIQLLVLVTPCWWPCRVLVAHGWTLPPTRSDSYQKLYWYNLFLLMMSMICSKHVENYKQINTLKRICASSWKIAKNHSYFCVTFYFTFFLPFHEMSLLFDSCLFFICHSTMVIILSKYLLFTYDQKRASQLITLQKLRHVWNKLHYHLISASGWSQSTLRIKMNRGLI